VLPDGSFGVATNQSWFHASWGDRTMCTPEYLGALSGHGNAKVQLMLSMGDANITSYRKAFANPRPLISGMLEAIIAYPADIVSGWNVDWEPCNNNNNNDKKNKARQQGGGAVTPMLTPSEISWGRCGVPTPSTIAPSQHALASGAT
jgi:hypothetical protein